MSEPADDPVAPLIRALDEASETLSAINSLRPPQAERIAARIDRLASQLASISPPVDARLVDEIDRAD